MVKIPHLGRGMVVKRKASEVIRHAAERKKRQTYLAKVAIDRSKAECVDNLGLEKAAMDVLECNARLQEEITAAAGHIHVMRAASVALLDLAREYQIQAKRQAEGK